MNFLRIESWSSLLLGGLVVLALVNYSVSETTAQESEFASEKAHWDEIEKQLVEKEQAIAAGDADASEGFKELVESANLLINQLRTTGLEELKKDPTNKEVIRTLMGILVNDASFSRDKEALQLGDELINIGIDPRYFEVAAQAERLTIGSREILEELYIRQAEAAKNDLPQVKFVTTKGDIVLELFENEAPNTVANFVSLIESGFYDGITFHRVLEDFMAQSGDPKGDGSGGPGYTIACECYSPEARRHFTGSLSMAKTMARDTGGSQFFLTFKRTDSLDGKHTVFGRVLSGWDILNQLTRTHVAQPDGRENPIPGIEKDKIVTAEIIRKRDHEYKPKKVGEPEQPQAEQQQPPVQPATTDDAAKNAEQPETTGGGEEAAAKPDAEKAAESGNPESGTAEKEEGGGENEPEGGTAEETEGGGTIESDDNQN